jgi:hypothetical protein
MQDESIEAMSLSSVSILIDQETVPSEVENFLVDISGEVEKHRTKVPCGYRGFVPSDYRKLYSVLRLIDGNRLTCGMKFCEWGSGIGVATMVASMVGFEAHGIEIDPALVEAAENLSREHGFAVNIACGSFVPEGVDDLIDSAFAENDGSISMVTEAVDAYAELGVEIDEFDIVFCFPWPTDETLTAEIFDRCASTGSLLLTYDEMHGFSLRRKD